MAGRPQNDWRKFCEIFVAMGGTLTHANGYASAAAKQAGYGNPQVAACRLLKRDDVREHIGNLAKAALAKAVYQVPSADEILKRIDDLSQTGKSEITKLNALIALGRYRALFQDRLAVDMPRRVVIEDPSGTPITTLGARG